jgi:transcriptional regulator with XRE-family HTH domain
MTDFGTNLRKLRQSFGLTQEALADALHLSTSVINRIENNKRKMDMEMVHNLSGALGIGVNQVVDALFSGKKIEAGKEIQIG